MSFGKRQPTGYRGFERRGAVREKADISAHIILPASQFMKCRITDFSNAGARLAVASARLAVWRLSGFCLCRVGTLGRVAPAEPPTAYHADARQDASRRFATSRHARANLSDPELRSAAHSCRWSLHAIVGGLRTTFARSIRRRLRPCTVWSAPVPHVRRRARDADCGQCGRSLDHVPGGLMA
jgi:hypothetical protein